MERVSRSSLAEFLARRPFSIVHIDAEWDGYRKKMEKRIHEVESQLEQSISFGYADCDAEQDYAREIRLINVPSIAYYRGAELFGLVIGIQQDISGNIRRLMEGQALDQTNVLSRG